MPTDEQNLIDEALRLAAELNPSEGQNLAQILEELGFPADYPAFIPADPRQDEAEATRKRKLTAFPDYRALMDAAAASCCPPDPAGLRIRLDAVLAHYTTLETTLEEKEKPPQSWTAWAALANEGRGSSAPIKHETLKKQMTQGKVELLRPYADSFARRLGVSEWWLLDGRRKAPDFSQRPQPDSDVPEETLERFREAGFEDRPPGWLVPDFLQPYLRAFDTAREVLTTQALVEPHVVGEFLRRQFHPPTGTPGSQAPGISYLALVLAQCVVNAKYRDYAVSNLPYLGELPKLWAMVKQHDRSTVDLTLTRAELAWLVRTSDESLTRFATHTEGLGDMEPDRQSLVALKNKLSLAYFTEPPNPE